VPLSFTPQRSTDRETRSLTVVGKLASRASLDEAQAEMDLLAGRLARPPGGVTRPSGPRLPERGWPS